MKKKILSNDKSFIQIFSWNCNFLLLQKEVFMIKMDFQFIWQGLEAYVEFFENLTDRSLQRALETSDILR